MAACKRKEARDPEAQHNISDTGFPVVSSLIRLATAALLPEPISNRLQLRWNEQLARLEDIPINERKMVTELDCSGFEDRKPWIKGPPLAERRVAIVSTAALTVRTDAVFQRDATDYRVIPGDVDPADLVMSHVSVNFDRTGFQQDVNICFPLERLRELEAEGTIGSIAKYHYTLSGAANPQDLEGSAREIAKFMKADAVDTVLLVPI